MAIESSWKSCIAAMCCFAAGAHAAEPNVGWSATAASTMGGVMSPGVLLDHPRSWPGELAALDRDGNLLVVGTQGDAFGCIVTLKYAAPDGAPMWRQQACAPSEVRAGALAVGASGEVFVTGGVDGSVRAIKYSRDGLVAWDRTLETAQRAAGVALVVDALGDVLLMADAAGDVVLARLRGADGSTAWQRHLDGGGVDVAAGLVAGASGHAIATLTSASPRGDRDWWILKVAFADGASAWEARHGGTRDDRAAGVAVDGAGHVTVAGSAGTEGGEPSEIRLARFRDADGALLWERGFTRGGDTGATALRADARGNAFVTGYSGGAIKTLKYSVEGALAWEATFAATGSGAQFARALALDPHGDVIVTGISRTAGEEQRHGDVRTLKYAGADGAELWNAVHRGGGTWPGASGHAVVANEEAAFAVGQAAEAGRSPGLVAIKYVDAPAPPAAAKVNVQGLWWGEGGRESGWGVNLTQQGEILFATWFTYDGSGRDTWLVMSRGERIAPGTWRGTLYRMRGSRFDAERFDPAATRSIAVGTATFSFEGTERGELAYTVDGAEGRKPIERHVFATPVPKCEFGAAAGGLPNYGDLWWAAPAGAESGWGLNVAHQGDVLFVTWFTYAPDGSPLWLVGPGVAKTGRGTYAGPLYRMGGPPLDSATWDASRVAAVPAGTARLAFDDDEHGTFTFDVDGIRGSKPIVRTVFETPRTTCRG